VKNISNLLEPYEIGGDLIHRSILFTCLIVYIARLVLTVFVFLKRTLGWGETLIISFLMSLALFAFVREGGSNAQSIGSIEITGIFLYITGSYINTLSEYTRYIWKKDPENKGRLYTEGLFRYSMHINYFGDSLLFTGFALVAHSFAGHLHLSQASMLFVSKIISASAWNSIVYDSSFHILHYTEIG